MIRLLKRLFNYKRPFWVILKDSGIILYNKNIKDSKMDLFFGDVISAFYALSEYIFKFGFQTLYINNFQLRFYIKRNLLFVKMFSSRTNKYKIVHRMNYIAEKFCSLYPEIDIDNWDHDVKKFYSFNERVKQTQKRMIGNYINNMWDHSIEA